MTQVDPLDVWRTAKLLVDHHGADARLRADMRASELAEAGDQVGVQVWQQIAAAIGKLQRRHPSDGESRH